MEGRISEMKKIFKNARTQGIKRIISFIYFMNYHINTAIRLEIIRLYHYSSNTFFTPVNLFCLFAKTLPFFSSFFAQKHR